MIPDGMDEANVDCRAAALTCLLLVGVAVAADEPWELWEEVMPANAPVQMRLVERFSSSEACQSEALQLSEAAPTAPTAATGSARRLGYTCLPAASPPRSTS
jgi:hypothetical protein